MKTILRIIFLISLICLVPSFVMAGETAQSLSQKLCGTWIIQSGETAGSELVFLPTGKIIGLEAGENMAGEELALEWSIVFDDIADELVLVIDIVGVDEDYTEFERIDVGTNTAYIWTTYYAEQIYKITFRGNSVELAQEDEDSVFLQRK